MQQFTIVIVFSDLCEQNRKTLRTRRLFLISKVNESMLNYVVALPERDCFCFAARPDRIRFTPNPPSSDGCWFFARVKAAEM
jgi:hypothetical protein